MALLHVAGLKVYYPIKGGILGRKQDAVRAVDDVSFSIAQGESYGLVGESGCGKSTTAKAILGLVKITAGKISFDGKDLHSPKGKISKDLRKEIQMVFQDPYSALNPKKTVREILLEPIRNFYSQTKAQETEQVAYFLEKVRLTADDMHKYPHQFSGGQRQRIGIARALTLKPRLIVADEPVSALDVSVQAQVLNFLKELQREFQLTLLLIGHDLGVIRHMCDRVGVMYRGRMVEEGRTARVLGNPQHIYTRLLMSSIPETHPQQREEKQKQREVVRALYQKEYSKFFDKNSRVYDLVDVSPGHRVALPGKEG